MTTSTEHAELIQQALGAFAEREVVIVAAADQADAMAAMCHQMARRFLVGGKILAFGNGGPTTDAQHVSVEFVHPVIVGKKALPAVSLNADGASVIGAARHHGTNEAYAHLLGVLGRSDDIALGLSSDGQMPRRAPWAGGRPRCRAADRCAGRRPRQPDRHEPRRGSRVRGRQRRSSDREGGPRHGLPRAVGTGARVPGTARLLDDGDADALPPTAAPVGVEALYPFLYDGRTDLDAVLADVAASTRPSSPRWPTSGDGSGRTRPTRWRPVPAIADAFAAGGKLLAFGNGGSSSDAQQVAQVHLDPPGGQRALPALCLTNDVAVVTALSNDVDFDVVFARQVRAFGQPGDIALGLSTSGNSGNVIQAFAAAT
jgi:D-sedoheptulose 7-phosphate isomerase